MQGKNTCDHKLLYSTTIRTICKRIYPLVWHVFEERTGEDRAQNVFCNEDYFGKGS